MAVIYLTVPGRSCVYELPAQVGEVVTIGTDAACRLALPEVGGLSPQHARIDCTAEGYVLSDMGSAQGIVAGERRVESEYMSAGVVYVLGEVSLMIASEAAEGEVVMALPIAEVPEEAASASETVPGEVAEEVLEGGAEEASESAGASAASASAIRRPRHARKGAALNMEELRAAAEMFNRNRNKPSQVAMLIYVVVVLAAAFYAGMALHHWQKTGNYLPGIIQEP